MNRRTGTPLSCDFIGMSFRAEYSLAGCSPAAPTSASSAAVILNQKPTRSPVFFSEGQLFLIRLSHFTAHRRFCLNQNLAPCVDPARKRVRSPESGCADVDYPSLVPEHSVLRAVLYGRYTSYQFAVAQGGRLAKRPARQRAEISNHVVRRALLLVCPAFAALSSALALPAERIRLFR